MDINTKYPFFEAGFAGFDALGHTVRVSPSAFGRVSRVVHEGNSVQLLLVDMNNSGARELFILSPDTVLEVVRPDGVSYDTRWTGKAKGYEDENDEPAGDE